MSTSDDDILDEDIFELTVSNMTTKIHDTFYLYNVHIKVDSWRTIRALQIGIKDDLFVLENYCTGTTMVDTASNIISAIQTLVGKHTSKSFPLFFSEEFIKYTLYPYCPSDIRRNLYISAIFRDSEHYTFNIPIALEAFDETTDTYFIDTKDNTLHKPSTSFDKYRWPLQQFYIVVRTIERWINTQAQSWNFPAIVEFTFSSTDITHQKMKGSFGILTSKEEPSEIIVKRVKSNKLVGYNITSNGYSVRVVTPDKETTDIIPCNIDMGIWKSDRERDVYRQKILSTINTNPSKVPKSLTDVCSMSTIVQKFDECWYISVVVLVSKAFYNILNQSTRDFLDIYRQNPMPVSSKGASLLVPWNIANEYRVISSQAVTISRHGIMNMHEGGRYTYFLFAIMNINNIPYLHRVMDFDDITDIDVLRKSLKVLKSCKRKIVNDMHEGTEYAFVLYSVKHMNLTLYDFDEVLLFLIQLWKKYLIGGLINVDMGEHHTIMFTICEGKAIICNHGECVEKMDQLYNSDAIRSIFSVRLLVQKNTILSTNINQESDLILTTIPSGIVLTVNIEKILHPYNMEIHCKIISMDTHGVDISYLNIGDMLLLSYQIDLRYNIKKINDIDVAKTDFSQLKTVVFKGNKSLSTVVRILRQNCRHIVSLESLVAKKCIMGGGEYVIHVIENKQYRRIPDIILSVTDNVACLHCTDGTSRFYHELVDGQWDTFCAFLDKLFGNTVKYVAPISSHVYPDFEGLAFQERVYAKVYELEMDDSNINFEEVWSQIVSDIGQKLLRKHPFLKTHLMNNFLKFKRVYKRVK